jgi:hypothetical protein
LEFDKEIQNEEGTIIALIKEIGRTKRAYVLEKAGATDIDEMDET